MSPKSLNKPSHHTGNFEHDAPAAYAAFKRLFERLELKRLCNIYSLVFNGQGTREPEILREIGMSYNPKPARICHILMREVERRSAAELSSSMLSCLSAEKIKQTPPEIAKLNEIEDACQALDPTDSLNSASGFVKDLHLAHKLDFLRHLHMMNLDSATYTRKYQEIEHSIKLLSSNSRLIELINSLILKLKSREQNN